MESKKAGPVFEAAQLSWGFAMNNSISTPVVEDLSVEDLTVSKPNARPITISFGRSKEDREFEPQTGTFEKLYAHFKAPKQAVNSKANLSGWCAGHVKGVRQIENVTGVDVLTVEYDQAESVTLDERDEFGRLKYEKRQLPPERMTSFEAGLALWDGYERLAVTSYSHTEEVNRFRVVILLSRTVTADEFSRIWHWAHAKTLGAGHTIDPSCSDPSRYWFRPVKSDVFRCEYFSGEPLDVEEILKATPAIGPKQSRKKHAAPNKGTRLAQRIEEINQRVQITDLLAQDNVPFDGRYYNLRGERSPSAYLYVDQNRVFDFGVRENWDSFEYIRVKRADDDFHEAIEIGSELAKLPPFDFKRAGAPRVTDPRPLIAALPADLPDTGRAAILKPVYEAIATLDEDDRRPAIDALLVRYKVKGKPAQLDRETVNKAVREAAEEHEKATKKAKVEAREAIAADDGDTRPEIYLSLDEEKVNDQVIEILAKTGRIYERGNVLTKLVLGDRPRAMNLPVPTLGEYLSSAIRFMRRGEEGPVRVPAPSNMLLAIHSRGSWDKMPKLHSIVEHPFVKPDGSICMGGFDSETATYAQTNPKYLPVKDEECTLSHALKARDKIMRLVKEFPFVAEAHRSAWLADLLTHYSTSAISGNVPLFAIDANTPGTGKTLLFQIIEAILTGRDLETTPYATADEAESRKNLTANLLRGKETITYDNIAGPFGSAALDQYLTTGVWSDRLLGSSQVVEIRTRTIIRLTGNNIEFKAQDTLRRVLYIRIETNEEHPEERTNFEIPNVRQYAKEHRYELTHAALTILRAYILAGRPKTKMPTWGSFEEWSDLVRGAIVWLGMADPAETRALLRENTQPEGGLSTSLLEGWDELARDAGEALPCGFHGITIEDAVAKLRSEDGTYAGLRAALSMLAKPGPGGVPDARSLMYKFRSLKGRKHNGMRLMRPDGGERLWYVEKDKPVAKTNGAKVNGRIQDAYISLDMV